MPLYGDLRSNLYRTLQEQQGRPISKKVLLRLLVGDGDRSAQLRLGAALARGITSGDILAVYRGQYIWRGEQQKHCPSCGRFLGKESYPFRSCFCESSPAPDPEHGENP